MPKYLLMMLIIVIIPGMAFGDDVRDFANTNIRDNGVTWMTYGPGIITSCKAIKINMKDMKDQNIWHIVVITDYRRLQKVKKWIMENFKLKLNQSPVTPVFRSVIFPITLVLYGSEEMKEKDLLLSIPLNAATLGNSYDFKSYEIAEKELNELIENK